MRERATMGKDASALPWISTAPVGESITGFALVLAIEEKQTREGANYLHLLLSDPNGQVVAKFWDIKPQEVVGIECHSLVKVRGIMGEWQNKRQLRLQKIRLTQPSDQVDPREFVKSAPESGEEMLAYLHAVVEQIEHPQIQALLEIVLRERKEKLLVAPAASHNHHAIRGGLLYHIKTMLRAGFALMEIYPFLQKDLLTAGIILHDIAKLEELTINPLGIATEYSREGNLLGHLVMGIMDIDRLGRQVGMAKETTLLLEHMVLSHHYEPEFGSPKRPAFPEAELLHYLDIIDARLYDMNHILTDVVPGTFSERVWSLDKRRLYQSEMGLEHS